MTEEKNNNSNGVVEEVDYKPTFRDFYNLMKFKVTKILLVSSLYDAFILEEEGLLTEQISGEYQDLELTSPPQVIRVPSGKEALKELEQGRYDLIITMSQISGLDPYEFGKKAKEIQKGIPVVLLITNPASMSTLYTPGRHDGIDKVFYWTGDSALFFAIAKYIEDSINIVPDTKKDIVKAILVMEDFPTHYSTFLPIFYTEIVKQTQALIAEGLNEQEKWLRKKTRPKILLAETFEEGEELYKKHKEHLLGIITDVAYQRNGKKEQDAGFQFVRDVVDLDIPVLVQSSNLERKAKAGELGLPFLHKNSETFSQDLSEFFKERLCFGDFVFTMPDGDPVARVYDINGFLDVVQRVPLESIRYHAEKNDFSKWLMARGEIDLARKIQRKKTPDFKDDADMRKYLIDAVRESRQEKRLGVITDFIEENFEFDETFTKLGGGSLGGKGRGLAFLAALLYQNDMRNKFGNLTVRLPDTLAIGTDVFDWFMVENNLYDFINEDHSDKKIIRRFLKAKFPKDIKNNLKKFLSYVKEPLAVRSSSLLEDSQNQPFSGIYATYMIPNNSTDEKLRLKHLCKTIKLVYASTYKRKAKAYIQSTLHKAEEKMAVIIQKLVGQQYGDRFYPVYSGVAQSYNFYPIDPLTREDGIVSIALGLGKMVVDGGNSLIFSPNYPKVTPGLSSPDEFFKNTQREFYSLKLNDSKFNLIDGEASTLNCLPVSEAMPDGTLDYVASTYDINDDRLRDGVSGKGPKIITFAGILKYNMLPIAETLKKILKIGRKGMGRPVEIEFAGTTDKSGNPEFYVLQIRPLVKLREHQQVQIEDSERGDALVYTENALGNGIIDNIWDIVYVPPERFDTMKTRDIAREIGEINKSLEETPYALIGPGRWGTRDQYLGIPVEWDQISWARTIVEVSMEHFRADPSYGSHFFHNIISLGIMYLTVPHNVKDSSIDWKELSSFATVKEKKFVRHVKLPYPLNVKVDGRVGNGVILKNLNNDR